MGSLGTHGCLNLIDCGTFGIVLADDENTTTYWSAHRSSYWERNGLLLIGKVVSLKFDYCDSSDRQCKDNWADCVKDLEKINWFRST